MRITIPPEDHESEYGIPENVFDALRQTPPVFIHIREFGAYFSVLQNPYEEMEPELYYVIADKEDTPVWHKLYEFTQFNIPAQAVYFHTGRPPAAYDRLLKIVNTYFNTKLCHCNFIGIICQEHNVAEHDKTIFLQRFSQI